MGKGSSGSVRTVRIFLASPSADTGKARSAVVETIKELQADEEFAGRLIIDLLRWDDAMRAVMCEADHNPQIDICEQIGHPGTCDLLIGLFAHTMGGTLPEREPFGRHPDGRLWHCSEWEVAQALDGKRAGVVKSVWRFQDARPQPDPPKGRTVKEDRAYREQSYAVREYLDGWRERGESMTQGYQPFEDEAELAQRLRIGLRRWLRQHFMAEAFTRLASEPAPIPAVSACRQRELIYLGHLLNRHFHDREIRYVPLAGEESQEQRMERVLVDPVMPTEMLLELFPDTDLPRSHAVKPPEPVPYQDVLDAYRALPQRWAVRRLAVLGEPGAGKSFSLQRIACELARAAQADASRPVPVLAAMGLWNKALEEESLEAFLARQLGVPLEDWHALVGEGRALLLLDAINEIPPGQRKAKVAQIKALVRDTRLAAVVLSCRERDFEADFQLPFDRLKLLPLRPVQILEFLRRTLALVYGAEEGERRAQGKFRQIKQTSPRDDRRSLIRLAANPYLLSMMMELPSIPTNRAGLFKVFLKRLHRREHETRIQRGDGDTVPAFDDWRAVLVKVAEALQRADGVAGDDGARTALVQAEWPAVLTDELLVFSIDASVLQQVGGDVRFTHQLLQESLAADVLLDASHSGRRPASDFWPEQRGWKRTGWEVVAEIAGEACGADELAQYKLIEWLSASTPKVASDVWKHLNRPALPAELRQAIADQWCPRLTDNTAEPAPEARAAIGEWLGALDLDRRPGTGLRADGVPDIEWVLIDDDQPFRYQDTMHPPLPRYEISRYPVTNWQWQAFIDDGGYSNSRWWAGLAERMEPDVPYWTEPTAPRESVSWYEAMAYCRWLSAKLDKAEAVTLPTEQQWERAARGVTGRTYAWGDKWRSNLTNAESRFDRTTVVGLYPNGATPEGILDMTGNVWEWCLNQYDEPKNCTHKGNGRRVLRGGSWQGLSDYWYAFCRYWHDPEVGSWNVGLRLVRTVPHSEHGSPDHRASDATPPR